MNKYFAYTKNGYPEKLDNTYSLSYLNAANYFSKKKNIPLKKWLEIYLVLKFEDLSLIVNKNVYIKLNNKVVMQFKVCSSTLKYIAIKRFNDSDIEVPKMFTIKKFINFLEYIKKEGYIIKYEN